jgi:hypothetical protein
MSESQQNPIISLLREHPALLVSMIYVVASTIGMLYSWDYLRLFGINFFNYAQVGDFLLASLKEPFTWAIVIGAIVLAMLDNAMSRRVERKGKGLFLKWYGSGRYRMANYIGAAVMVVLFTHIYATTMRDRVLNGGGRIVSVQLTESPVTNEAVLLGTTGTFIFLYDPLQKEVSIHPHESIYSISFGVD